jgi:hypothetical protein
MNVNKKQKVTSLSKASSLEEVADFWDAHSLADYEEQTHEVEFEVRATRKRKVSLDPEVYEQIEAQAVSKGIQAETLINLWLSERLHSMGS